MKIVVLATAGRHTDVMVNYLEDAGLAPDAVLVEPAQSRKALLKARARKLGWFAVLGQVLFMALALPVLRRATAERTTEIGDAFGLRFDAVERTRVTMISSVNASETRTLLEQLKPDVLILSGTRILKSETINAADAPVLNIHAGITPAFRGVHGGYWALRTRRRKDFGATVHMVDKGVDTGSVLEHVRPDLDPKDNFVSYPLVQLGAALPALVRVLERLRNEQRLPDVIPTQGQGKQWYHPTLWQYLVGRLRGVR